MKQHRGTLETVGTGKTGDSRHGGDTRDRRCRGIADTDTVGMGDTERDSRHREDSLCNSLWLLKMGKVLL